MILNQMNPYPSVTFQPDVGEGIQAGFDQLVNLIRPTLGPLPHFVAIEKAANRNHPPEILDSGGTIARRIIQIQDRDQDVGLLYLRQLLWKLQETEGDGTATAAVLFQSIYRQGRLYIAAGGNAMRLQRSLEIAARSILAELNKQKIELRGKNALVGLANSICNDLELAQLLGEILDIVGADGRLEVRKNNGRELMREYVEGMYWDNGFRSREMVNDEFHRRANLENPAVLISDLEIDSPEQLIPILQLAIETDIKQVLLISNTLSDRAISILLAKPNREKVFIVAVKTPGMTAEVQRNALEDIAILTGGKPLRKVTGDILENVHPGDFGRARRAWVDQDNFGIIGGQGDARVLRKHVASLRQALRRSTESDVRSALLERLGKLTGGSATLYIGGISPIEIEPKIELAKRTVDAMRGAMREGILPGGGVAMLECRAVVQAAMGRARSEEERTANRILLSALEAPFRTIVQNAGFLPEKILSQMENKGFGFGFDVKTRQVRRMFEAGIFDSATVVKGALYHAVAGAALALTMDVIVHHRNPQESLNP